MLVATWILLVLLLGTMVFAVVRVGAEPRDRTVTEPGWIPEVHPADSRAGSQSGLNGPSGSPPSVPGSVTGLYRHHSAAYWNWRYRTMRHLAYIRHNRIRQLKRTLMSSPSVREAINLASVVYGNGSTLWRKARCESNLNPSAVNGGSGSSGLFQFIGSTWRSTPFGGFSVFSPYAAAMAAGWMHAHGRGGEWQCR